MATPTISSLKGTGHSIVSRNRFPQEFSDVFRSSASALGPGLSSGLSQLAAQASGNPETFAALEAPALRQFQQLQGNIASRFSGMGSGARRSSGFQNTLNEGATDLSERLQSQRLGLQNSAMQQLMQMYGLLSGTDLEDTWLMENAPKKPSWWKQAAAFGLPIAGAGLGALGGPLGSALGGSLGGALGQSFLGGQSQNMDFSNLFKLPTKWG